jgi:PAS domain S-box-containing protein
MSLVVRVIAPIGRDAELITEALRRNGLAAEAYKDFHVLLQRMETEQIGPLLLAEEALNPTLIRDLGERIRKQPTWSDLPVLILTSSGRETSQSNQLEHRLSPLGSPVLLERPIRTVTLVSSVRAAIRARERQYEIHHAFGERDSALAELRQEQETLQVMLDNLPVGILLAKPSGEIVLGNRSVERILRHPLLPTPDVESHGKWVAFHPDGHRMRGEEYPLPRAMKFGHPIPPEDYLYSRGDGTLAWVRLAAAPVFNEQGRVSGGVVAISDIDQQKRAESALRQSEKLAAVGRLAASISHEINNPLEAVTNLLYLLEQATKDQKVRHFVDMAQEELSRVSQIVTHTLRFHRQSTRPRIITPEELLEPTLGLYRARLRNLHIDLEMQHHVAGDVVCYEGDIRQVLNNLIANAIDSMRSGGRLLVRTSRAFLWRSGIRGVRITVADTGHGIPPAVKSHIFEPFYTTKGNSGTGLGLWISKDIVSKHHGRLQIRSCTGETRSGTVVSLFLPAEEDEESSSHAPE